MTGRGEKIVKDRYLAYLVLTFILILLPVQSFCAERSMFSFPAVTLDSITILSKSLLHLLLTLLGALIIICLIIVFFSLKLKNVNRELRDRNQEIEKINKDLQNKNKELAIQKDLITKEHSESDTFFRMLIQSADDGISFYDRDWNLKFANSAFYSLIGHDPESYLSSDPADFVHPDDQEYQEKRVKSIIEKGFFESELKLRHKDGHYVPLSTRSVAVVDNYGEILGSLTISRDITKLKQAHEELIKANVEVETSNRLKTSFLANISHEIRTPLNSVVGFSNLLLSNDITREAKEEYIEHINHNSEKLLQIIGDIIDLSRLESSQIEITYEEASVNAIVNEVIDEARKVIRRNEKSIILNKKTKKKIGFKRRYREEPAE